ncbi:MAG: glycosyltransferase family 4 protein [Betaproteobacteria bacterium]
MRIAYVTETFPPEINGVSLTVERTVRFLRERGHSVDLIRPRQRGEAHLESANEWRTGGMPIPMYPDLRLGFTRPARLKERFELYRPDIVHIATQGPLGYMAARAARSLGLPVTTDFRTNFHSYSRYYRLGWLEPLVCHYLRSFHNRADLTFVPTRALRDQLRKKGFKRLEVVGRGVDTALFTPAKRRHELRRAWGAGDEQSIVMLYVGRLAAEKNVELALRAFTISRYLRPNTQMVVVGDGPQRQRLEANYPLAHFVGVKHGEELAHHYASADLFVFPSQSETFGNVTLEAMASGLAVVAFDGAAVKEHVRNGQNGIIVGTDYEGDFIQTACRTAAMADLLAPLCKNARDTAKSVKWETISSRFEKHLTSVAASYGAKTSRHAVLA